MNHLINFKFNNLISFYEFPLLIIHSYWIHLPILIIESEKCMSVFITGIYYWIIFTKSLICEASVIKHCFSILTCIWNFFITLSESLRIMEEHMIIIGSFLLRKPTNNKTTRVSNIYYCCIYFERFIVNFNWFPIGKIFKQV